MVKCLKVFFYSHSITIRKVHIQMSTIIYLLMIVLMIELFVFLHINIRKQQRVQELSLSDKTNIIMTFVNVALLILAFVSINIAIESYRATENSGIQQQRALDASNNSLSSVVKTLKEQQEILDESRRALKQSFNVVEAQWKRQLEKPDIHAILLYPAYPHVIIINNSKIKPLMDGHYQFFTLNIDRWLGSNYQIVQAINKVDSAIPPKGTQLQTKLELRLDPNQPLKEGDRLYGYLSVSCSDCVTSRCYWVLIKYGKQGSFVEVTKDKNKEYSLITLMSLTPSTIEKHINGFLLRKDRIEMIVRPPWQGDPYKH